MKALTSESQNFSTLKVLAKASCMIGLKGLSILLSKTMLYREILRSLIRKINKVKQAKIHCAKVGRVKGICPKHYKNRCMLWHTNRVLCDIVCFDKKECTLKKKHYSFLTLILISLLKVRKSQKHKILS
jgi:hypothetical protein